FGGMFRGLGVAFKLIDAADTLSVQVHPSKTEMWYVLDCEPGAKLISGLSNGYDREEFVKKSMDGTVTDLLRFVPVKKGDVFFIPRGLVHAIGGGITLAEIQQNSNVTYRVYDFGRVGRDGKPRELHLEAAIGTIKDISPSEADAARFSLDRGPVEESEKLIADCEYFRVRDMTVLARGTARLGADGSFLSIICVDGEGRISGRKIRKGDSFILPDGCRASVSAERDLRLILTDQ
ncbi:MAG: class I mannose-6-phosphate isomerase, partial [Clostridia bacterium]|nr:class I mannose-6-phosphate isomerase [Clostridia bacterium]